MIIVIIMIINIVIINIAVIVVVIIISVDSYCMPHRSTYNSKDIHPIYAYFSEFC